MKLAHVFGAQLEQLLDSGNGYDKAVMSGTKDGTGNPRGGACASTRWKYPDLLPGKRRDVALGLDVAC